MTSTHTQTTLTTPSLHPLPSTRPSGGANTLKHTMSEGVTSTGPGKPKVKKSAKKPGAKTAQGASPSPSSASPSASPPSPKKKKPKPKGKDAKAPTDEVPSPKSEVGMSDADSPRGALSPKKSKRIKREKKSEEVLCHDLFKMVDVDLGGTIDQEEMTRFIKIVDPKAPPALVEEIIRVADEDGNGDIDVEEFTSLCMAGYLGELASVMIEKYKGGLVRVEKRGGWEKYLKSIEQVEEITKAEALKTIELRVADFLQRTADPKKIFKTLFDLCDSSGEGSLSHADVSKMIRLVLPSASQAVINAVIQSADKDGNGDVDFEEFQIAIEEGSFGMTAEELLPAFQGAIKVIDERKLMGKPHEEETTPQAKEEMDEEQARAELKRMQKEAEERRAKTKAQQEDQKRRRLRSRLVDFYATHNPEKVREDEISRIVDVSIAKHIDEDDLFRSLYKKYGLDESGEPIAEDEESDWDASSEDIDETLLTEEERKALQKRRELRENYRQAKKEEALFKAVQTQIKREAADDRARSRDARKRFIDDWKTEDERKKLAEEERIREEDERTELRLKQSADREARAKNRKIWNDAVENAKDQRFEELDIKVEQKRIRKNVAHKLYTQRTELQSVMKELDQESNKQIALSQNIRVMKVILENQERRIAPASGGELHAEIEKTKLQIDEAQEKLAGLRHHRGELVHMNVANKQYNRALAKITDSLKRELEERKESIRTMREECLEELNSLRGGSHVDLISLETSLDGSLEAIQADLKRREELRLEDGHHRQARERGINEKMLQYTEQCNSEIKVLKERLLELYPAIIMDMTSRMGKFASPTDIGQVASPVVPPKITSPPKPKSTRHQSLEESEEAVISLGLYQPRKLYVRSGGHTGEEMCGVVQVNEEVVFDKHPLQLMGRSARLLTYGSECAKPEELSPCESLPLEIFSAMQSGAIATHWRNKLGLSPDDVSLCSSQTLDEVQEKLLPFSRNSKRKWEVVTERGATIQISVEVRAGQEERSASVTPSPSPSRTWGGVSPGSVQSPHGGSVYGASPSTLGRRSHLGTTPKPQLGVRTNSTAPVRLPPTPPNPPPSVC